MNTARTSRGTEQSWARGSIGGRERGQECRRGRTLSMARAKEGVGGREARVGVREGELEGGGGLL